MSWHATHDVLTYAEHVLPALEASPVTHTVPLSILHRLRTLGGWSDERAALCWSDDGGIALMTPPFDLYVAVLPPGSGEGLTAALAGRTVPGVSGDEVALSELLPAFGRTATTIMRSRLYGLEQLTQPQVPGSARPASADDLDLVLGWWRAFMAEAVPREAPRDHRSQVEQAVLDGRVWMWQPGTGSPVAMAGRNPVLAGAARVGPVWTSPEHRRQGYAAAVTAACAASALADGAEQVVLFTDLDNPTSNALYQQIGFRAISDRRTVRLDPPR